MTHSSHNCYFFRFGAGVPFEFAVVLGVVVPLVVLALCALGAWGVFCWVLAACTRRIASVSKNVGDVTETDKPMR